MLDVNKKYFNLHSQLGKDNFWLKKIIWKVRPSTWKKSSNILGSKKAYGLKISQSIIYVKKYFHMFFSTLKNIIQAQSKKIIELAKTLWLFA